MPKIVPSLEMLLGMTLLLLGTGRHVIFRGMLFAAHLPCDLKDDWWVVADSKAKSLRVVALKNAGCLHAHANWWSI